MVNNQLQLTKYRFTLEATDNIILPAYKGSTFHGGFGHALMQISPIWYRYFFEPKAKDPSWPKPYVILPPLDTLEKYPIGHQFYLELTLIGEATQHYSIAQAAIEYLGVNMGLGSIKGKYKIVTIDRAIADNTIPQSEQHHISANQIINSRVPTLAKEQTTIHFPSRLRLKHQNKLHRKPPEFQLIFERLAGRIKSLGNAYGIPDQGSDDYEELRIAAQKIEIQNHNLDWKEWHRFSGSQKALMKFGGLVGEITYEGDMTPFLPYLALGEWLHIGGKTSFGLGKYILSN